jgi:ABC-2 type transport system permease protein
VSVSWELILRGVRTVRRSGTWWAVGVVTFVVINLAFWPSLEDSGALDAYEGMEDLMEAFGVQSISTPEGYVDGQVYALLLPLLFSAMAITMVSALTAGDENAGRLELLHALPLSRRQVWLGRWTAAMVVLALVAVVGGASTLVSLPLFSLTEVSASRVVMATIGCALLAAFHGSVAYAAAGFGASRGLSAGVGIFVLVAGYLMSYVLPISDALAGARDWSPWYWAIGEQPVTNGIEVWRLFLTAALTIVLIAIGTWAIDRRDIHTA